MTDTLISKLHETQQKLKVPKSQKNKFGNYNYRSCEDILEAVKKVLPKDCFVTLSDEMINLGDRYYVKASALFQYNESSIITYGYAREAENKKGMDESQITGAASSYARKYALNGLFAIDDTKDSDFTNKHEDVLPGVEAVAEATGAIQKDTEKSKEITKYTVQAINAAILDPNPDVTDAAIEVIADARKQIKDLMSTDVNKIKKAIKELEEKKGIKI